VIWPLIVTIIVILLANNMTAFRESRISKARTSIGSVRGISYINPSALDQDCVNIGLVLGNDLTNYNSI
jgi:enhancing lycopene biosynthesis protein 2